MAQHDSTCSFSNLLMLTVAHWVTHPFEVNVGDEDIFLQENLFELQRDEIFEARFKDEKHNVWKSNEIAKNILDSGRKCSWILLLFHHFTLLNQISAVSQKLVTDSTWYKEMIFDYHLSQIFQNLQAALTTTLTLYKIMLKSYLFLINISLYIFYKYVLLYLWLILLVNIDFPLNLVVKVYTQWISYFSTIH